MMGQVMRVIEHRAALNCHAGGRRRHAAGDNQRHAMSGALGVKGRQSPRAVRVLLKPGMH